MGTAPQPEPGAAAADGAAVASGTSRILPNTVFRAAADVGSKLISVGFYVVIARKLGASAFGSLTFGLAFGALVTVLAGFGQDAILTREVARDRRRVDGYFANTIVLKLVLSRARDRDRGARARARGHLGDHARGRDPDVVRTAHRAADADVLRGLPGLRAARLPPGRDHRAAPVHRRRRDRGDRRRRRDRDGRRDLPRRRRARAGRCHWRFSSGASSGRSSRSTPRAGGR